MNPSSEPDVYSITVKTLQYSNYAFILYLIWRLASVPSPDLAFSEFVLLRNGAYLVYAICIGIVVLGSLRHDKIPPVFLPGVIANMILTTFSYTIAAFVAGVLFHRG